MLLIFKTILISSRHFILKKYPLYAHIQLDAISVNKIKNDFNIMIIKIILKKKFFYFIIEILVSVRKKISNP